MRRRKSIEVKIKTGSTSIDITTDLATIGPETTKIEIEMVIGINDHGMRKTAIEMTGVLTEASILRPPIRTRIYQFQTTKSRRTICPNQNAMPG